jgi:ATP-dependent helicase HepA
MFIPGQRWISTAEPELGLGTVLRVEGRGVQVLFAKSGVLRPYAVDSAPLVRAEFRAGQRISGKGIAFLVERVEEREGLLVYRGEGRELHEGQLDDEQSVSQADDRLIGGRTDPVQHFELRLESLKRRAEARRSASWGLSSARIGLVPHQLRVQDDRGGHDHRAPDRNRPCLACTGTAAGHAGVPVVCGIAAPLQSQLCDLR